MSQCKTTMSNVGVMALELKPVFRFVVLLYQSQLVWYGDLVTNTWVRAIIYLRSVITCTDRAGLSGIFSMRYDN